MCYTVLTPKIKCNTQLPNENENNYKSKSDYA